VATLRLPSVASRFSPSNAFGVTAQRAVDAVSLGRLVAAFVFLVGLAAHADQDVPAPPATPVGLWQTVSDNDGKTEALVRIREQDGELRGVIETLLDPVKRADLCRKCPGDRQNQPVQGLTIITGLRKSDDGFAGGEILDPKSGRIYSCRMHLIDGGKRLEVRGFLGFSLLGRTQTWIRQE